MIQSLYFIQVHTYLKDFKCHLLICFSNIESSLNNKHTVLSYNYVQWNFAAGVVITAWIDAKENFSNDFINGLSEALLFNIWELDLLNNSPQCYQYGLMGTR